MREREIIFSANFNQCASICTLQLILEDFNDKIIVIIRGEEKTIVDVIRDQWGVWLGLELMPIMQEDETKSFLDAYIKALTILRSRNEFTEPAFTTIEPPKDKE